MVYFFSSNKDFFFAIKCNGSLTPSCISRLQWLFRDASLMETDIIHGTFIGPRKEMITPWSTNAVEITQNMGIKNIERIEEFFLTDDDDFLFDPMLQSKYKNLTQDIFSIDVEPAPIIFIDDIATFNIQEGLALSKEEIEYLNETSRIIKRKLTDSEIFGFSQVNSEHCRHKIFNGIFIVDGIEKKDSLFQLIKLTTKRNPNTVVSAYSDNCAFMQGPTIFQFAPATQNKPDWFTCKEIETVIALKAETHNFPTTVEPFNGAATGSGGEIRDRIAGGKGSIPLAGTAVYMTSYPRLDSTRNWEQNMQPRKWLYQTPKDILIKASNGASDFGNKFGQPLICGSVLTFEHSENNNTFGFDKVIMLAGGVGFGKKSDSKKDIPSKNDRVILMGGDNYRIGMGGGAVSSVATGEFKNAIELNAVQRSNPEMQKRIFNAIRALTESDTNPIISIHDHGAGGHLNCLSELCAETGGTIEIDKLPVGDPTLSAKEIIGNESQERMGFLVKKNDVELIREISERERAPMYDIGETTGDDNLKFSDEKKQITPFNLKLEYLFGNPPTTIITDNIIPTIYKDLEYDTTCIESYIEQVLQLESVACKDWLTNKVDRSVTGRVALQQTAGEIQLPLNNFGIMALDFHSGKGIATAIGHAPVAGLIDAAKGSVLSIAESLTNIVWAPIEDGLKGVSLSANWMWPCKNAGEDARLYQAVEAASKFAIELGINIPTGKDSLSMTQKYPDGKEVYSPGTVIISAVGNVSNINKTVKPVISKDSNTILLYIPFTNDKLKTGGSALGQILNRLGNDVPSVPSPAYFVKVFNVIQELINKELIISGHDISSGGLITTLLEMNFANNSFGMNINLDGFSENNIIETLFSENPALVIQIENKKAVDEIFLSNNISYKIIGDPINERYVRISKDNNIYNLDINKLRDVWYKTSYLLDINQSGNECAGERFKNYKNQVLDFNMKNFTGKNDTYNISINRQKKSGVKSAIIREKGVNGDREMAYAMHYAGMDVKDVHMTDLISGRETLEDINFIVFVGGFSNSDVLGSAKGWAGAFMYNEKAKQSLNNFYARHDSLTLGVCNGCQLIKELGLITPDHDKKPQMLHNDSHKFESGFISVDILESNSIMLKSLAGQRLGIWVAHGEGKFHLPKGETAYNIPLKYSYSGYPGNPNGSDFNTAGLCSADGRHLAMMPHLERAIFPWNWAHYPQNRKHDEVTPWIEAYVNAREWIKNYSTR